jgi:hypothetical protein
MNNAFGWLRLPRWALPAAAIGLVAALAPAVALAQAGPDVIKSFNGSGLTLRAYINGILKQNNLADGVADAPHQNFWDKLSYKEFTTGNVPGVDAGPNPPYRILVVGDGANSNLVLALQGKGPLFDKDTGAIGRMPANANPPEMPFFTDTQIEPIIDWINRHCPNPGAREAVARSPHPPLPRRRRRPS